MSQTDAPRTQRDSGTAEAVRGGADAGLRRAAGRDQPRAGCRVWDRDGPGRAPCTAPPAAGTGQRLRPPHQGRERSRLASRLAEQEVARTARHYLDDRDPGRCSALPCAAWTSNHSPVPSAFRRRLEAAR